MYFVKCHDCGRLFNFHEEAREVLCPQCGLISRAEDARKLSSLSNFLERIRDWPLLPDDLRADLAARVTESLEEAREAAVRLAPGPETPGFEIPVAEEVDEETEPPPGPPPLPDRGGAARAGGPVLPAAPTVWSRLGPVFAENSLFVLAAFLIVAGAVFFVTTAWTTMSGTEKLLVVVGGIVVLGGILFAAGKVLNRGGTLSDVERVLVAVTGFLLPVAAVPAGLLLASEPALGAATAGILLVLGYLAVREVARTTQPAVRAGLPAVATVLAAATIAAALAGKMPATAGWVLVAAFLVTGELASRRSLPRCADRLLSLLWPGILLAFGLLAAAGAIVLDAVREGAALRTALPVLGMASSALGAALVLAEGRLAAPPAREGRRLPVLLGLALAFGVTGAAIAIGNERALLWAAALGSAAAIVAALRLPVPGLLVIGLALAAAAYLKLPAPFREAAMRVRDDAARELGYEPKALPLAWYGITFLPFVAACGLAAAGLHRIGRAAHADVTRWFTVVSSLGLALMALILMKGDHRAPAAVLSAQGALLIALSPFVRDRWFAFGGTLAVFAGLACGLSHLDAGRGVSVAAVAGLGLVAVLAAARLLRGAEGLRKGIAEAVIDATTAVAALLAVGVLLDYLASSTWWVGAAGLDIFAYVLLSTLVALLGAAYREPVAALLACLLLAPSVESALLACGLDPRSGWRIVFFAAASAVPFLAAPALRFAGARVHRSHPWDGRNPTALLFSGVLALQALGFLGARQLRLDSWPEAGGLLACASVLAVAAVRFRLPWFVYLAVAEFALAGPAVHAASTHRPRAETSSRSPSLWRWPPGRRRCPAGAGRPRHSRSFCSDRRPSSEPSSSCGAPL